MTALKATEERSVAGGDGRVPLGSGGGLPAVGRLIDNPAYRGLGWSHLRWMFTSDLMGPYMPLAWLTYALDYVLWGLRPFGYHLTSIACTSPTWRSCIWWLLGSCSGRRRPARTGQAQTTFCWARRWRR